MFQYLHQQLGKTNTRFTAEHTFISSMALILVVATPHYEICDDVDPNLEKEINQASDGVKIKCWWIEQRNVSINARRY